MRCFAIVAVVATVAGVSVGARALPEFAERYAEPVFPTLEDADDTVAVDAQSDATRSNGDRRARPAAEATKLWGWSGASPGDVRTVTLTIDPAIYPIDGLRWFFNGAHDRDDIHGPLDAEFGLWHSSTRQLAAGDIVSACWTGRDNIERCPQIVVRSGADERLTPS